MATRAVLKMIAKREEALASLVLDRPQAPSKCKSSTIPGTLTKQCSCSASRFAIQVGAILAPMKRA
jgi:hypothetical protein